MPRVYTAKPTTPPTVAALHYRAGTPQARAAIRQWLADTGGSQCSAKVQLDLASRVATVDQVSGGAPLLVIEQPGADAVQIGPGEFLVRSNARWHACPRREFESGYDLTPREVPIYDDGE